MQERSIPRGEPKGNLWAQTQQSTEFLESKQPVPMGEIFSPAEINRLVFEKALAVNNVDGDTFPDPFKDEVDVFVAGAIKEQEERPQRSVFNKTPVSNLNIWKE